jgi:general secretion pathway protein M
MNGLMSQAAAWWDGRTLREQRMLTVMGLAIAAVLVWLLIVRPAWAWRADAAEARAVAEADLALVQTATGRMARTDAASSDVDVAAVVAEVGSITGVTPVMGMSPDGGLGFNLTNVSSTAAFGWLAALHDRKVEATTLNVVENADATISVEGVLAASCFLVFFFTCLLRREYRGLPRSFFKRSYSAFVGSNRCIVPPQWQVNSVASPMPTVVSAANSAWR